MSEPVLDNTNQRPIDELVEMRSRALYHCNVCAPAAFQREVVTAVVNRKFPVEELRRWSIASGKLIDEVRANPQPCDEDPTRLHWLLVR